MPRDASALLYDVRDAAAAIVKVPALAQTARAMLDRKNAARH